MCAQRAGVDRGFYGGSRKIVFFEVNGRVHAGEGASDGHDTHVLGGKLHLSMHRIHRPTHHHSPFSLVADTTLAATIVCQPTFHCATSVLRFRRADLPRGEELWLFELSVPEAKSAEAGQQSRLNAWHAFLVARAALEPILNRELEAA